MKYLNKPILGTQLNWSHSLNKGLVGFWLFNEGHGNKVNDLSMNNNTGICTGMADPPTIVSGWNPGRTGTTLAFDGVNNYVEINNMIVENKLTFSGWINLNKITGTQMIYMDRKQSPDRGLQIYANNASLTFLITDVTTTKSTTISGILTTGGWHHIAWTIDLTNDVGRVYYDGVQLGADINYATITEFYNVEKVYIGKHLWSGTYWLDGKIDEVRIYNRALSASEIQQLYAEPYCMFL